MVWSPYLEILMVLNQQFGAEGKTYTVKNLLIKKKRTGSIFIYI